METVGRTIDSRGYFEIDNLPKYHGTNGVQFLSMGFVKTKQGNITQTDTYKFMSLCKDVIESDVFDGIVCYNNEPFFYEIDLTPIDTKRKVFVNSDGSRFIMGPETKEDKVISKKEDIVFRTMMVMAFKSKISKSELEERFGKFFYLDGQIPDFN